MQLTWQAKRSFRWLLIVPAFFFECGSKENECCLIKVNSKALVPVQENINLGMSMKTFLNRIPINQLDYDEELDYYKKCRGDRWFHLEQFYSDGTFKIRESHYYTFCDSILAEVRFSFDTDTLINMTSFTTLVCNLHPEFKDLLRNMPNKDTTFIVGKTYTSSKPRDSNQFSTLDVKCRFAGFESSSGFESN